MQMNGGDAEQMEGEMEEDEDYDPREAEAQYYAMQEEMFAEQQRQAAENAKTPRRMILSSFPTKLSNVQWTVTIFQSYGLF